MTQPSNHQRAIDHAATLCRRWEGFSARPYKCPAGVPTIGYGCTRYPSGEPVKMSDAPLTADQANALLIEHLSKIAQAVITLCPPLASHQTALGCVTSWTYNLGTEAFRRSTMRIRLLGGRWALARAECVKWTKINGVTSVGLERRRAAEAAGLFPDKQNQPQH